MEEFDRLIGVQLQTMDKLLFLQSEIERCQEIERQLRVLQELGAVSIQEEIEQKKSELAEIQKVFEKQTEEVIRHFQLEQAAL
ncbi:MULTISPECIES: YgaB family protein [Peribacillus]|uniref:Uncharacterized protein n=1 Tax=Peribacillus asahii TaxID=228899 RepID=A0A3T0KLY7_9BACI|nr:YgaB family protein [Peribacillus asahii]AZV41382.1 hypothetical protein BAOM_0750 [Peribacillus asahii]USK70876.1 hypothetical protein LIS76_03585 [Peribacillus asahii]USK85789.1 hypothetical protein LIT35_03745 [Peribacillus asahii]